MLRLALPNKGRLAEQTLELLERDPAAGYLVMRRLSELIARYLTSSGSR